MTPRSRRAVSRLPLFSTRLSRSRSSAGVISAIGERLGQILQEPAVLVDRDFRHPVGFQVLDVFCGDQAEGVARG
jgi:hypothetical protein